FAKKDEADELILRERPFIFGKRSWQIRLDDRLAFSEGLARFFLLAQPLQANRFEEQRGGAFQWDPWHLQNRFKLRKGFVGMTQPQVHGADSPEALHLQGARILYSGQTVVHLFHKGTARLTLSGRKRIGCASYGDEERPLVLPYSQVILPVRPRLH